MSGLHGDARPTGAHPQSPGTGEMTVAKYYLPQNVHMCVVEDQVVILDLRRDKYLSLDAETSAILRPYVELLAARGGLSDSADEARLGELLSSLSGNAILCTSPGASTAAETYRPLTRPEEAITPRPPFRQHVCAHHVVNYIGSVISAKLALRTRSLHQIVFYEYLKRSALRCLPPKFDADEAAQLCSIYSRLRIIATGPGQCLFDSLALKLFLANYRIFPDWIFGVRLNPFGAHCWLQHGSAVVNDSLDSVRPFTPIMAA